MAAQEGLEAEALRDLMAQGKAIIMRITGGELCPEGGGDGLSVKVNANIGTSPERINVDEEIEKLRVAEAAGADAIMDFT